MEVSVAVSECGRSVFVFFFFKQKTAYEMRISDWSSDVCSSDLSRRCDLAARIGRRFRRQGGDARRGRALFERSRLLQGRARAARQGDTRAGEGGREQMAVAPGLFADLYPRRAHRRRRESRRSEEHTSELQSLMRSSYAVFCLKK